MPASRFSGPCWQLACIAACGCLMLRARAADCAGEATHTAGDYAQALAEYRAGNAAAAFAPMAAAFARCPGAPRYREDYIAIAAGTDHATLALAAGAGLDPRSAPDYVLAALARAARDAHQPDAAINYYDLLLARGGQTEARVGRDLALLDRGEVREARADLELLAAREPARVDVLEALGLARAAAGDKLPALAAAQAVLRIDPQHAGALMLRFRMLVESGAPRLALDSTPAVLLTSRQRGAALQDALALELRWARATPQTAKVRAAELDAVIGHLREAIADATTDATTRHGMNCDLIEALVARGHNQTAVEEYERLVSAGMAVPPDATAAAADAYLARQQPERALNLLRSLPNETRNIFAVRSTEIYALLESGHPQAATAAADRLVVETPRYANADSAPIRTENGDYVSARVLAALSRAYGDRPADADRQLQAVLAQAPANEEALLALAQTESLRGWPRRAAATALGIVPGEPESEAPLQEVFQADLQMRDYAGAARTMARLHALVPADDAALLRAEGDWQTHAMAELRIDGQLGRSHGGRPGVVDSVVDEYGFSPALSVDYRVFVHLNQSEGTPLQGDTFRHAVGAGLEYRNRDWLATVELLDIDRSHLAPQLSVEATPDDTWTLGAAYAWRTLDTPIAATVVGVHADRAAVSLEHRSSESRDVNAVLWHEAFSDGNSRYDVAAGWRERCVTGPVYKLDARVEFDSSTNTLRDTNYFNPRRDLTATVTLENQWQQSRRYDRVLAHELDVGFGAYAQQGADTGPVALLRYQLRYEWRYRFTVQGGLGTTLRPYDGRQERLDVLNLNFMGRF